MSGGVRVHMKIVTRKKGPLNHMVSVLGFLRQIGRITLLVKEVTNRGRLHKEGKVAVDTPHRELSIPETGDGPVYVGRSNREIVLGVRYMG